MSREQGYGQLENFSCKILIGVHGVSYGTPLSLSDLMIFCKSGPVVRFLLLP